MTIRTIDTAKLDENALDLMSFLDTHMGRTHGLPNGEITGQTDVYVRDSEGRVFTRATLTCEMLSDGSEVFNIILSGEG